MSASTTRSAIASSILSFLKEIVKESDLDGSHDETDILAEVMCQLDPRLDMTQYNLERMAGAVIYRMIDRHSKFMFEVYEMLVEKGHDEDNEYVYNDLDNTAFYIPHDKYKIWSHRDQNRCWLYMLEESYDLEQVKADIDSGKSAEEGYEAPTKMGVTIYQHWTFDNDEEDCEDLSYNEYVSKVEWLDQYHSDNVEGNNYIYQPDLQWFKDCDFNTSGNCFVKPIVLTCGFNMNNGRDIYDYQYTQSALTAVGLAHFALNTWESQ